MKTCVPVVGLAGYSGSGKTTFLEKLLAELKRRGYRLGVIKHTHHEVEFDRPGKDTWRHRKAGADVVTLVAPNGMSLTKNFTDEPRPEDIIEMMAAEVDLIIVEGYKNGSWPRIEVFQAGMPERPIIPASDLLAVVRDTPHSDDSDVPVFARDDAVGPADLIEREIIRKSSSD